MVTILRALMALARSHGMQVARHAKAIAIYGALIGVLALIALIYIVILFTHLLALLIGTAGALAAVAALALAGCLVLFSALRTEKRRLVAVHRAHLKQERLALKAAGIEAVEASKLGGSIAAVSASFAAAIIVILRRLGFKEGGGTTEG